MTAPGQIRQSWGDASIHVRNTANTDHKFNASLSVASCQEPTFDSSFNHLVGEREQLIWNFEAERLAVVRLMMRSNLVGCSTGMSPGFAPRRILST
jgi:hypothetical protein